MTPERNFSFNTCGVYGSVSVPCDLVTINCSQIERLRRNLGQEVDWVLSQFLDGLHISLESVFNAVELQHVRLLENAAAALAGRSRVVGAERLSYLAGILAKTAQEGAFPSVNGDLLQALWMEGRLVRNVVAGNMTKKQETIPV